MSSKKRESLQTLRQRAELRQQLGGKLILPPQDRPRTRADCKDAPRPCPWVGCRYHLFLEVKASGGIAYRGTDDVAELAKMPLSCVLDAAELGGMTQTEVGEAMGFTMQAAAQVETRARDKMAKRASHLV